MLALITALLLSIFPAPTNSSWMQPDAFRLSIGMKKSDARKQLERVGLKATEKKKDELVVAYGDQRTLTLTFRHSRLHSARFELVDFMPAVKKAFEEQQKMLSARRGAPSRHLAGSMAIWEGRAPHVFVVATIDPASEMGKQGLAMLIVRYLDPATD